MMVDLEYAEEHFEELCEAVDNGEEVFITHPGKGLIALVKVTDETG